MKVFISYAAKEKKLARFVAARLASAKYDVWFDEWALEPGANWATALGKGLEASDAMIVLVSPDASKSDNVRREIEYAIVNERFAGKVIPVLVKDSPDMPWILRKFTSVEAEGANETEIGERVVKALAKASA